MTFSSIKSTPSKEICFGKDLLQQKYKVLFQTSCIPPLKCLLYLGKGYMGAMDSKIQPLGTFLSLKTEKENSWKPKHLKAYLNIYELLSFCQVF